MSDDAQFRGQVRPVQRRWTEQDAQHDNSAPSFCATSDGPLSAATGLASLAIETSLVADLSDTLHHLFDHVCDTTLPIYFGPLLGRLYLEGL